MLLENPQNRRLLGEALADRYAVAFALDGADGGDGPYDLCIADAISLARHRDALERVRKLRDPLFLPVLLLADRSEIARVRASFDGIVDDVLLRPVERFELAGRVQALLRTRRLSLRAQRLSGLYEQEMRIAQRLQSAALPSELPEPPDLHFDGVYAPAGTDATIGGDWFDVLRVADGRVVVTIGDVVGSGLEAAVTMSKLRQVVRGVAHVHPDPALILEAADRTLAADEPGRYATVLVCVFDVVSDVFTYASAGHPPPVLRGADGALRTLPTDGLLLGTGFKVRRARFAATLPSGAALVVFTDGLTEATHDFAEGEARLSAALTQAPVAARAIYDRVIAGTTQDDVAILVVRRDRRESPDLYRRTFPANDAAIAREVQREIATRLLARGAGPARAHAADVIFAELLGNCVRYAPGPVEVALDTSRENAVLHVIDGGAGFRHVPRLPQDLTSEGGRGLYIVRELAEEFTVESAPGGGSHARAVL